MSRPFDSDDPFLRGNFAPWPMEGEVHDVPVRGEVPRDLAGTLLRIGSNPQFAPRGPYHWFFGDGMVHGFRIEDGRVHYRNRFVRTQRFLTERAAGEALFGIGETVGQAGPDPRIEGVSGNPANTNVLAHAGRVYALCEGGEPYLLDASTLDTVGPFTFGGMLEGAMTAHVKLDPETGEMVGFGYGPFPPFVRYHVVSAQGELVESRPIDDVDVPTMMHDFVVTRDHVIFMVCPATLRPENMASGMPVRWEPELGTRLGVMPRRGGGALRWFDLPPCYVFHPMNGYDEQGRIVADVCRYPRVPLFDDAGTPDEERGARLTRWTLDLAGGGVKEERLDDLSTEFPRLDERRTGLPYRFGYAVSQALGAGPTAIVRFDHARGTRTLHPFAEGDVPGEAVFVPRGPAAAEGEGVLLTVVYRGAENRSDLVILDAERVDGEPLAVVELPHRVPFGFHGNWVPDAS